MATPAPVYNLDPNPQLRFRLVYNKGDPVIPAARGRRPHAEEYLKLVRDYSRREPLHM